MILNIILVLLCTHLFIGFLYGVASLALDVPKIIQSRKKDFIKREEDEIVFDKIINNKIIFVLFCTLIGFYFIFSFIQSKKGKQ